MAASGVLGGAVNDLTGNIETAYLVVHDYRQALKKAATPGPSGASSLLQAAAQKNVMVDTPDGLTAASEENRIFRVQFNPSQIQIYTSAPAHTISNVTQSGNQQSTDANNHPRIEMTLPLMFDAMNPADSFMMDKFTAGVSAQQVTNIASAAKGKVYSVQPQMEGLIAVLRNPLTRQVTFHWSDFEFFGQIKQLMAKYTMFSVTGRPVRGQVTLRISHRANSNADLADWMESYQRAFGGARADSLVRSGQRNSNLINVNVK